MSLQDLQKAVLGPSRWRNRIADRAQLGSDCNGSVDWEPREKKRINLKIDARWQDLYLVPGGRFLITGDSDSLKLWDLGLPWMPALSHPLLLTEEVVPYEGEESLLCIDGEVSGDNILRVIVSASYDR